jgi:hypothetical protein
MGWMALWIWGFVAANAAQKDLTATGWALDDVPNPGRGFNQTVHRFTGKDEFEGSVQSGRVYQYNVELSQFCSGEIDPLTAGADPTKHKRPTLVQIEKDLAAFRAAGATVLFRAAYYYGGDSLVKDRCRSARTSAPDHVGDAASVDVSLKHIRQLAPVLNRYRDVVLVVQSGLQGKWGEGHYFDGPGSKNGAVDPASVLEIVAEWRKNLAAGFPISVRRPQYLPGGKNDLTADVSLAPIWFHNDALLNKRDEGGTWWVADQKLDETNPIEPLNDCDAHDDEWWPAWEALVVDHLTRPGHGFGAEVNGSASTCQVKPAFARAQMESFGLDVLTASYQGAIHRKWEAGPSKGFRKEVARRLGYRLHLAKPASIAWDAVDPNVVRVAMDITNSGFDAPNQAWRVSVAVGDGPLTPIGAADPLGWLPAHRNVTVGASVKGTVHLEAVVNVPGPITSATAVYLVIQQPWADEDGYAGSESAYRVCLAGGDWQTTLPSLCAAAGSGRRNLIGILEPR